MKYGLGVWLAIVLSNVAIAHEHSLLNGIEINQAWARASAPNAPSAGYMNIANTTEVDDVLLGVEGDFSKRLELHKSVDDGGVMRMLHQENGIIIPAGQTVYFKPGGYHLMFMGLSTPFVKGETYTVILSFKHAGDVELALPVKTMQRSSSHGHSH